MIATEWAAVVGAAVVAAAVQRSFTWAAGPARPLGDEIEYLERAAAEDPTAPGLFIRVPGFIWFVWCFGGRERPTRVAQQALAVLTVALATTAAAIAGGAPAAWVCGVALAFLPDRWVLAGRIWPDVLLALQHALVMVLLVAVTDGASVSPWWFGLVAASAVVVRIDAMALPVVLAFLPLVRGAHGITVGASMVLLPTVAALAGLAFHNRRRHGVFAFDTTLAFNVRVMQREQRDPGTTVQVAVDDALADWEPAAPHGALQRALSTVGSPVAVAMGFGHRLVSMAGADTFARERLLPATGGWPDMPGRLLRPVVAVLRVSTPVLIGAAVCGVVAQPGVTLQLLVPLVAAYVAMCAVHARTRFRAVLFPWLATWAGLGAVQLWRAPSALPLLLGATVAVIAAVVPPRRESQ